MRHSEHSPNPVGRRLFTHGRLFAHRIDLEQLREQAASTEDTIILRSGMIQGVTLGDMESLSYTKAKRVGEVIEVGQLHNQQHDRKESLQHELATSREDLSVLANTPYVKQEAIGRIREQLIQIVKQIKDKLPQIEIALRETNSRLHKEFTNDEDHPQFSQ